MASNLSNFYSERCKEAIGKWDTEKHQEALTKLSDFLMEPQLPLLYRSKANLALGMATRIGSLRKTTAMEHSSALKRERRTPLSPKTLSSMLFQFESCPTCSLGHSKSIRH